MVCAWSCASPLMTASVASVTRTPAQVLCELCRLRNYAVGKVFGETEWKVGLRLVESGKMVGNDVRSCRGTVNEGQTSI